jgi:hypothetical protein
LASSSWRSSPSACRPRWRPTRCVTGPYGEIEAKGCDDYRQETEGGYIVIDNDGRGYGSGGECAWKIKSVKKTGKK